MKKKKLQKSVTMEPPSSAQLLMSDSSKPAEGLLDKRRKSLFSMGVNTGTALKHTRRAAAPRRRQSRRTKSMDDSSSVNWSSTRRGGSLLMADGSLDASARIGFETTVKKNQEEIRKATEEAAAAATEAERVAVVASSMRKSRRRASMEMKMKRRTSMEMALQKRSQEEEPNNEGVNNLRASTGSSVSLSPTREGIVAARRQTLFNVGSSPRRRRSSRRGSTSSRSVSSSGDGSGGTPSSAARRSRRGRRASQMVLSRQQQIARRLNTSSHHEPGKRSSIEEVDEEDENITQALGNKGPVSLRNKRRKSGRIPSLVVGGGLEEEGNDDDEARDSLTEARLSTSSMGALSMSSSSQDLRSSTASGVSFGDLSTSVPSVPESSSAGEPILKDASRKRAFRRRMTAAANLFQKDTSDPSTTAAPEEDRPNKRLSLEEQKIVSTRKKDWTEKISSTMTSMSRGTSVVFEPLATKTKALQAKTVEATMTSMTSMSRGTSVVFEPLANKTKALQAKTVEATTASMTSLSRGTSVVFQPLASKTKALQAKTVEATMTSMTSLSRGTSVVFEPLASKTKALQAKTVESAAASMTSLSRGTSVVFQPLANKTKALQAKIKNTKNSNNNTPASPPPRGHKNKWFQPKFMGGRNDNELPPPLEKFQKNNNNSKKSTLSRELAAVRIQKFLKESTCVLRWYRNESIFWTDEAKDIQRRRMEELHDVQAWIEVEKQTFRLQLLEELHGNGDNKVPSEVEETKQQLRLEKSEHERLQNELRALVQENQKLERDASPLQAWKRQQLKEKISVLKEEESTWNSICGDMQTAVQELQQRKEMMQQKTDQETALKTKTKDTIEKVQAMTEGKLGGEESVKIEEELPPLTTTKLSMPTLVREPTGTAEDFTSGRKASFDDLYTMGDMLGEGAFGAVYLCTHKASGVQRAVKIIQKDWMTEWELDDTIKEFEMLTQFDSDNVIRVYEFYDTEDTFYMVQELATGGELFDELEKRGKLPEPDAALLMKNVLACAEYLEQHRIVHRDLNLENVLLQKSGDYNTVKLIDFGLAAKCEEGEKLFEMVGKPRYVAPEVLGDDGYDLGYDVWSCGVCAATLLTGFFPFEADSDFEVYQQITDGAYINYNHKDWEGVSDQAKDFVRQLLQFKEEDRPTASQAMKHPWLTGNTDDTPIQAEVWVAPKQEKVSVFEKNPQSDRAARIIQKFLRDSAEVLAWYRREKSYWEDERQDIARRRQEELEDTKKFIELEKQQFELELLNEAEEDPTKVPLPQETVMSLKAEYARVSDEYNKLKESIRQLIRDNTQLGKDNPLLAAKIQRLEKRIARMADKQGKWEEKLSILVEANQLLKEKIAALEQDKNGKKDKEQSKQDAAARKIQRFLSESVAILKWHREEMAYWLDEQKDIERRRLEELEDTKKFCELEKKRFLLQLFHEMEEGEGNNGGFHPALEGLEKAKCHLENERQKHNKLKESIRKVSHENKVLQMEGSVSMEFYSSRHVQKKIEALKNANGHAERYLGAQEEAERALLEQIASIQEKRVKQQGKIKRLESCIARITGLTKLNLESNDPKLVTAIDKMEVKSKRRTQKSMDSMGSNDTASTCSDNSSSSRRGSDIIEEKKEDKKSKTKAPAPFSWRKHALRRQSSAPDLCRMMMDTDSDSDSDDDHANIKSSSSNHKRKSDTGPKSPSIAASSENGSKNVVRKVERRRSRKGKRGTMKRMDSAPMIWTALAEEETPQNGKKARKKSIKQPAASISDAGKKKDTRKARRSTSKELAASYSWGDHATDDDEESSLEEGAYAWGEKFKDKDMASAPLLSIIADTSMREISANGPATIKKSKAGSSPKEAPMKRCNTAPNLAADKSVKRPHKLKSHNDTNNFSWEKHTAQQGGSKQVRKSIKRGSVKGEETKGGQNKLKSSAYQWEEHQEFMESATLLSVINASSPKPTKGKAAVDRAAMNKSAPLLTLRSPKREKKGKNMDTGELDFNESAPLLSLVSSPKGNKVKDEAGDLMQSAPMLSLDGKSRSGASKRSSGSSRKKRTSTEGQSGDKATAGSKRGVPRARSLNEEEGTLATRKKGLSEDKGRSKRGVPRARSLNTEEGANAAKFDVEKSKRATRAHLSKSTNAASSTKSLMVEAEGADKPGGEKSKRGMRMALSKSVNAVLGGKSAKAETKEKTSKKKGPAFLWQSQTSPKSDSKDEKKEGYSWRSHMKRMDSAPSLLDASSQDDHEDGVPVPRDSKSDHRRKSMKRNLSTPNIGAKEKSKGKRSTSRDK